MREGYWANEHNTKLPIPQGSIFAWDGQEKFLVHLDRIEALAKRVAYRGFSVCRLCKKGNGSEDFTYQGWTWPSGYAHYIRDHNVRPSLAFQEFILGEESEEEA